MKTILKKISLIAFGFCLLPMLASATGILSEPIEVENARRGQTHWEDLLLMNSDGKEIIFELSAEGILANWVEFYSADNTKDPITKIAVAPNTNLGIKAKFSIPDNVANGKYQGQLISKTAVSPREMSGDAVMNIVKRFGRDVSITVTDNQILDFNTIFIPVSYSVAQGDVFRVRMIHENHGNVDIKPNVELRISQNGEEIFKAVFPYPDNDGLIQPNERKEIENQIEWRTKGYDLGNYDVVLSTFHNDKLNQKEEFMINIGTDKKGLASLVFGADGFGGKNSLPWVIATSLVLLVVAILVITKLRKSKNSSLL